MRKIANNRNVTCRETQDRFTQTYEWVGLWVADMVDGTTFYTSKGGTVIFGTAEKIDSHTDIADVFDFQTIDVPGGVHSEDDFLKIVEKEAVVDLPK